MTASIPCLYLKGPVLLISYVTLTMFFKSLGTTQFFGWDDLDELHGGLLQVKLQKYVQINNCSGVCYRMRVVGNNTIVEYSW